MNSARKIQVAYGGNKLPLELPLQTVELSVTDPQSTNTPDLFRTNLHQYLKDCQLDLSEPALILADKTRLCGYPEILPVLLEVLGQQGMEPNNLTIIIAYGTHPRQSEKECLQTYGTTYNRYSFQHHDCFDTDLFEDCGVTSRGTPIRFRKDIAQASCIITMGAISHHYFAGYGGGRKLIFPGCGERKAIYQNHGLFLDAAMGTLAPGCQPGVMTDNPLAEDLFEIEAKLPSHLALHGILDSRGKLCDLLIGKGPDHFLRACEVHGDNCEVEANQFDTVIGSCGGYPKDINFIQSHKAIHNASMFVKDGGTLILYAQCRDGIGSKTFLPWFETPDFDSVFEELVKNYEGNGGTALAMMTKLQRIRICLVTDLQNDICKRIGIETWTHGRVQKFLSSLNNETSVSFIANSSLLVKKM